ncbi:MAG TPA: hypothetical protein VI685_18600 [Candidatus Angelobacter sp.]
MKKKSFFAVIAMIVTSPLWSQGRHQEAADGPFNIPTGPSVKLDGVISAGEWDHAVKVQIAVATNWTVTALLQHDDKNLYVAFVNLRHAGVERYPEVLLDPANQKPLIWQKGQWWLHASYNLCESNVKPDEYASCTPSKPGWDATRFPLRGNVSEIAISLDKVGLSARSPFGIALDVTDTKGQWNFWPPAARLTSPFSWQTAILAGSRELGIGK